MPRDPRVVALEKARPCPWCGSTHGLTLTWMSRGLKDRWQVTCQNCTADGPLGVGMSSPRMAIDAAVKAWNNREAA